ncbi:MAG: type restriction enzyme [Thermosipho sp. (in: thermotogales)]|nr:type restriction enzyme [Thermosipho sp. (in: thermotogales)]
MMAKAKSKERFLIFPLLNQFIDEKSPKFENLPEEWQDIDFQSFSETKNLWDFQVEAIKFAVRTLYYYYEKLKADKEKFWSELAEYASELDLSSIMDIKRSDKDIWDILNKYFYTLDDVIPYSNFINRMSFWMATGSGKTLVIVKLIDILITYMERELIPPRDILFLTYRDDLIEQFKIHFDEFKSQTGKMLKLYELKDFSKVKFGKTFFEFPIFYYRSDNISDVQKDKIINYENYDNSGNWFVILDEAHKGDKQSSKSQQYFSILSRNGFLFNFSATFTDERDILTTVYEFNLSSYIQAGYGKEIRIFEENFNLNNKKKDFESKEKELILLKSLILLTYLKKKLKELRRFQELKNITYHSPLAVFLGNSVNVKDSDVKILFSLIKKISSVEGYNNILNSELFNEAIDRVINDNPKDPFGEGYSGIDISEIKSITPSDVLKEVFNADTPGDIEIIKSKSEKELAFKLMTSDKPFALIKIGDARKLFNSLVEDFKLRVQEKFESDEYFENLDEHENINLLIGSRAFYEGWDSNRPNIIVFINIGTGETAQKFVLQSIGRGLRVQPVKDGDRKRLSDDPKYLKYRNSMQPLETLFVWGTKKDVIEKIIKGVREVIENSGEKIQLKRNEEKINGYKLFVPTLKKVKKEMNFKNIFKRFQVNPIDYNDARKVVENTSDELLFFFYFTNTENSVKKINFLREMFNDENKDKFFDLEDYKKREGWFKTIKDIVDYISKYVEYEYIPQIDENDQEYILHYKNIVIRLPIEEVNKVKEEIESVYGEKIEKELSITGRDRDEILLDFITEHYYIPVIEAIDREVTKGKLINIIREKSEIDFIKKLEHYSEKFKFEWWMFSKIVENVDKVYIPYIDRDGREKNFYPDFIFWFKEGEKYLIALVDPKGTEHANAERKIDGYEKLFLRDGKPIVFELGDIKIVVRLFYINPKGYSSEKYRDYWMTNVESFFERVKESFENDFD